MRQRNDWSRRRCGRRRAGTWLVALSLLVCLSSCAGFGRWHRELVIVGPEPCPPMTEQAALSWAQLYPKAHMDFKVWMAQIINLCDGVDAELR